MDSKRAVHRTTAPRIAAGIGIVAIVGAGMVACEPGSRTETTATTDSLPFGDVQECPRDWKRVYQRDRSKRTGAPAITTTTPPAAPPDGFAGVGRITDVPEYHDCQKMLLANGSFGPLIAVFAAWELDSLDIMAAADAGLPARQRPDTAKLDSAGRPRTSRPGSPALRDEPAVGATTTAQPATPVGVSRSVQGAQAPTGGKVTAKRIGRLGAVILNLGERYRVDDFVIEPGFNCLYLWLAPDWQARIVPVQSDSTCLQPMVPQGVTVTSGNLKVLEDWGAGGGRADYPAVARWDYDPTTRQQYIGIKCGAAWCEVGSSSFNRSAAYWQPALPADLKRVRRIKGWYDEQMLAIGQADTSQPLVPSALKGTLIPHPRLDTYRDAAFNARWAPVAYVALTGTDATQLSHARTKWNLERAEVMRDTGQLNKVELCHATTTRCPGVPDSLRLKCTAAPNSGSTTPWFARITAANTRTATYSCVVREDHTAMGTHIPGTARWRWVLKDDTKWTRCVEGCCETDNTAS